MLLSPPTRAITERLRADPSVVVFATSHPDFWVEEFGAQRVRTFPIAESSMIGAAIGAAIAGLRPVVHLNRAAFAFVAMDQIVNQAAKLRYMSGGQFSIGITVQALTRDADHLGAQHEQAPYSAFAHLGGVKVAVPATIEEAGGLLLAALDDPNPVLLFESPLLYHRWDRSEAPVVPIPFGQARVWRDGVDVTIVAIGLMVAEALAAADRLDGEGISCAVLDPRTLVPLDVERIVGSARRTRRLVVIDEAPPTASIAAEIIAAVCERPGMCRALAAAPLRLCGAPVPTPFSPALQARLRPDAEQIVQAVRALLRPL